MAKRKAEAREDVRVFNPKTGQYETSGEAFDMHFSPDPVAEHLAQVEGEPAPGDRTEEELIGLDPADVGPVITTNLPMHGEAVVAESAPGQLGEDTGVVRQEAGKQEEFKSAEGTDKRAAATASGTAGTGARGGTAGGGATGGGATRSGNAGS
jgi:hypothetical protein